MQCLRVCSLGSQQNGQQDTILLLRCSMLCYCAATEQHVVAAYPATPSSYDRLHRTAEGRHARIMTSCLHDGRFESLGSSSKRSSLPSGSCRDVRRIALTLNASEPSGWTPLLYAARHGWSNIAQQLLAATAHIPVNNARLQSSGNTGRSSNTTAYRPVV